MSHRRTHVLAAGVLLAAPLLTSCGFDYATNRVNVIAEGTSSREGDVTVIGAVIIAGQDDAGVFAASLSAPEGDALVGVGAEGDDVAAIEQVEPVEIVAGRNVSLFNTPESAAEAATPAQAPGVPVSGSFGAGDVVSLTLTFEGGQVTTLDVPVVRDCYQYADRVEQPLTTQPVEEEEETHSPEESAEGEEAHEEPLDPYSCEPAAPVEH